LHLLIGVGCAFLIICAILPFPSKNPNLLSSLQEASTKVTHLLQFPVGLNAQYRADDLCI
jgi:hypothetical protein